MAKRKTPLVAPAHEFKSKERWEQVYADLKRCTGEAHAVRVGNYYRPILTDEERVDFRQRYPLIDWDWED